MDVLFFQKGDKRALALKVARADFDTVIDELRRTLDVLDDKVESQVTYCSVFSRFFLSFGAIYGLKCWYNLYQK